MKPSCDYFTELLIKLNENEKPFFNELYKLNSNLNDKYKVNLFLGFIKEFEYKKYCKFNLNEKEAYNNYIDVNITKRVNSFRNTFTSKEKDKLTFFNSNYKKLSSKKLTNEIDKKLDNFLENKQ